MGPGIALTLAWGGLRTAILSRSGESAARVFDSPLSEWQLAGRAAPATGMRPHPSTLKL